MIPLAILEECSALCAAKGVWLVVDNTYERVPACATPLDDILDDLRFVGFENTRSLSLGRIIARPRLRNANGWCSLWERPHARTALDAIIFEPHISVVGSIRRERVFRDPKSRKPRVGICIPMQRGRLSLSLSLCFQENEYHRKNTFPFSHPRACSTAFGPQPTKKTSPRFQTRWQALLVRSGGRRAARGARGRARCQRLLLLQGVRPDSPSESDLEFSSGFDIEWLETSVRGSSVRSRVLYGKPCVTALRVRSNSRDGEQIGCWTRDRVPRVARTKTQIAPVCRGQA